MLVWLVGVAVSAMAPGLLRSSEPRPAALVWLLGLGVLVSNRLGWWG